METTADFLHLRRSRALSQPRSRTDGIVHARTVAAAGLTVGYLAISLVIVFALGAAVLPMFLVGLPLGLVLLWEGADVLRSDEARLVETESVARSSVPVRR